MWPEGTITDILNRTYFELQGKQNIKIKHLQSIQMLVSILREPKSPIYFSLFQAPRSVMSRDRKKTYAKTDARALITRFLFSLECLVFS